MAIFGITSQETPLYWEQLNKPVMQTLREVLADKVIGKPEKRRITPRKFRILPPGMRAKPGEIPTEIRYPHRSVTIGDVGKSDVVKKWRQGKGTLAIYNVGDKFYVGEKLPSARMLDVMRSAEEAKSLPATIPTPTTLETTLSNYISQFTEAKKSYYRAVEDAKRKMNEIVTRGLRLGANPDLIMTALKIASIKYGWNMLQDPGELKLPSSLFTVFGKQEKPAIDKLKALQLAVEAVGTPTSPYYKQPVAEVMNKFRRILTGQVSPYTEQDYFEAGR